MSSSDVMWLQEESSNQRGNSTVWDVRFKRSWPFKTFCLGEISLSLSSKCCFSSCQQTFLLLQFDVFTSCVSRRTSWRICLLSVKTCPSRAWPEPATLTRWDTPAANPPPPATHERACLLTMRVSCRACVRRRATSTRSWWMTASWTRRSLTPR